MAVAPAYGDGVIAHGMDVRWIDVIRDGGRIKNRLAGHFFHAMCAATAAAQLSGINVLLSTAWPRGDNAASDHKPNGRRAYGAFLDLPYFLDRAFRDLSE